MRVRVVRAAVGILIFALAAGAPAVAKKKKSKKDEDEGARAPIVRVLKHGPTAASLPVFHDAKKGGAKVDSLLDSLAPVGADGWPQAGDGGWTSIDLPDGRRTFAAPSDGRPARLRLAFYVSTDAYRKRTLTVDTEHPVAIWLDAEKLSGKAPELALETGKHLVRVESVRDPSLEEPWTLSLAWTGKSEDELTGIETTVDPARGAAITDVLDAPGIGSLAISPDGTRAALGLSRWIPGTSKRESWIEVRRVSDGALEGAWRGGFGMSRVQWAPNGRTLSYVTGAVDGESSASTLWLADLEGGGVRPLLESVKNLGDYAWSPEGSFVVYSISSEAEATPNGVKRLEGLRDRWGSFRRKSHLHAVTVASGESRRLTAGAETTSLADIAPDGSRLIFGRTRDVYEVRPYTTEELWELDLETLEATLLKELPWLSSARYAPDGRRVLLRGPAPLAESAVNVPDGLVPNLYDGQLFLWDPATDALEPLSRDFDPSIGSAEWGPDGRIYLTAQDRDYERLYRLDPSTKTFSAIETGADVFEDLTVARRATVALGLGSSPWRPERAISIDLSSGAARVLHDPGADWFEHLKPGRVEPWSFTASDGKTIDARIYFPPDFDPQKSWPTIVYYYGGTSPVTRDWGGRYPKEYWASNGYVVFVPQPSGATGFGQSFSAEHVNDWGKTTSTQILDGTKAFLEAHPWADPEAVGCIGASYGGFMTMLLTTRSDLYAGAVAHAGISSLASYWGEGYWGYLYSAAATADSFPWNRRDIYVDQSPLFRADRVRVPLLLTHGAADTNVPVGESDQFYAALKLLGKEVEYLRIDGEDHWILTRDKRLQWSKSIVAWFDRTLKKRPGAWEAMYPPLDGDVDGDVDGDADGATEDGARNEAAAR